MRSVGRGGVSFTHRHRMVSGGGADPLAPGATVITRLTAFSDTTPDFRSALPSGLGGARDAVAGDTLTTYVNGVVADTYTLLAGDIVAGFVTRTLAAIGAGIRVATSRLIRGTHIGALSNPFKFKTGGVIIGYGQSNWLGHTTSSSSPPAAATGSTMWDGSSWAAVPAANGVRELLNFLTTDSGYPWGLISGGTAGVTIGFLGNVGQSAFIDLAAKVAAAGADADYIVWHQGEGDADSSPANSTNGYISMLDALHGSIVALIGKTKSQVPLITSSLSTYGGVTSSDIAWNGIQQALVKAEPDHPGEIVYSHSNYDAVRVDDFHWNAASYGRSGRRYAQTIAKLSGTETKIANWVIASVAIVDATNTDVTVTHSLGSDFTPASGITGFEITHDNGANWVTPSAAVRQTATVIRLTHSSMSTADDRIVRYQFGRAPVVSAPVVDNSSIAAPLNHTANQLLTAAGSANLPVPTFEAIASGGGGGQTQTFSGVSVGTPTASRRLIVGVSCPEWYASNFAFPDGLTFTPDGGGSLVSLTQLDSSHVGDANATAWYTGICPNGVTGTFELHGTGNPFRGSALYIWSVPNGDLSSAVPVDLDNVYNASAATATVSLSTSSGGFVLAFSNIFDFPSGKTATWTGGGAYAERDDSALGQHHITAADTSNTGNATNAFDATVTFTGSAAMSLSAVSFR